MTDPEYQRTEARLRSLLREVDGWKLVEFATTAASRARSMTCGSERMKKCELERFSSLADALQCAVDEHNAPKVGA